ncbi:MAG TPA: 4Fe-4S dicluster domain-containing protein, partial [Methanomassiliicoccales archaeon]|nr:4Fe-4S dicluster domain-containing protein [Methanomassiliicoccales archaeon]
PKETIRMVDRDIPEVGDKGLKVLDQVGVYLIGEFDECIGCKKCEKECPECALVVEEVGNKKFRIKVTTDLCLGTACKHCERICPKQTMEFSDLKITNREDSRD